MPTGAELFIESLERLGIQEIFTLVGDHLNEVLSEANRRGVRVLHFRHEAAAVHAADTWARVHRKPALSLVTGGPGHTNSLTGIAAAHQIGSPVIAVSGSAPQATAGRQVFQVIDQVAMAAPITKWSARVERPEQVPYYLGRSYREAISGRMGPVHLSIPVDVFAGQSGAPLHMPEATSQPEAAPSPSEIERAMKILRGAQHPVVIAGSGVWWADAGAELQRFLSKTGLPLYTVTMARGIVPEEHANHFGYADVSLNRAVVDAFSEADVVLVLGKRMDYRLALGGPRLFSPQARFIQVDLHGPELGANRPLEQGICADLKSTLRMMAEAAGPRMWPRRAGWLGSLRRYKSDWETKLGHDASDRSEPIHPAAFFAEWKKCVPEDVLYSWDGGDFVHWGRAALPANHPGGWQRLGPLASIGAALPNALALQMAFPERPVAMITGDGSLGFYLAELDTLMRLWLPVVIVVGNDAGWGIERELQKASRGTAVACELRPTRYDRIMKGFGGQAVHISRLDQVAPAVKDAFAARQPYLLNVAIRGVRSPFTEWQLAGKEKSVAL